MRRSRRASASGPQIINDSKTPSGRVHVGALRGVLIHDAIFRTLKGKGVEARYLFGVDDYDPLDEIPAGKGEHFSQYLGQPLCNVPPPDGSSAPDMAEHYMGEFWQVFDELGVEVERYRMRDVYREGRFNWRHRDDPAARRGGAARVQGSLEFRPARRRGFPSRRCASNAGASGRPRCLPSMARR